MTAKPLRVSLVGSAPLVSSPANLANPKGLSCYVCVRATEGSHDRIIIMRIPNGLATIISVYLVYSKTLAK